MANRNLKDVIGGTLFSLIGMYFLAGAFEYDIGNARRMGPGYFPMVLGGIALLIGVLIAVPALYRPASGRARPEWRSLLTVVAAMIVFCLLIERVGLLIAVSGTVLIAAIGDRSSRPMSTLLLAFGAAAGAWLIFSVILRLPLPAFVGFD